MNALSDNYDLAPPPLNQNSFALDFTLAGSTIINHDLYEMHARKILCDKRNFLGLFALDVLLNNRKGKFRKDGITPSSNHPLLVFFQLQCFHDDDIQCQGKASDINGRPVDIPLYLPDRPDLDLISSLLHDEGEDIPGFRKDDLSRKMIRFVDNIHEYIARHNAKFPRCTIDVPPTDEEIEQMRRDIPGLLYVFDLVTRKYKGAERPPDYYDYHHVILKPNFIQDMFYNPVLAQAQAGFSQEELQSLHARAARVKTVDKACNGATFVFRSKKMLFGKKQDEERQQYRSWVLSQIHKMRDIYFEQNFLGDNHAIDYDPIETGGFINAARVLHPESERFFTLMGKIMQIQLRIYTHDIANEGEGHGSPSIETYLPEYDRICFSPRIDLINIPKNRLKEVKRLDSLGKKLPKGSGMFGIPFKNPERANPDVMPAYHGGGFYRIAGCTPT